MATLVRPTDRAPARMIIGPKGRISMGVLETGTSVFYRSSLQKGDGGQAILDMNEATNYAFYPFSAEWLFLQVLKGYFNEHATAEKIAKRTQSLFTRMIMGGASWTEAQMVWQQMNAFLANRKWVFDKHYQLFFFVDQYPELAARFRMTFDSCFDESGGDAADTVAG